MRLQVLSYLRHLSEAWLASEENLNQASSDTDENVSAYVMRVQVSTYVMGVQTVALYANRSGYSGASSRA